MSKSKLYAFLIGINKYEHQSIRDLVGCENDVDRMQKYLESHWSDSFDIITHTLKSAQATKSAIVSGFQNHFKAATKEDVIVLYFSGHGGQEEANKVFHDSESDKLLENFVCHDAVLSTTSNLLADKELRYLIHQVTQQGAEIVTIFDSCHSGDNSRNVNVPIPDGFIKKITGSKPLKERNWNDFLFAQGENGLTIEDFEEKPIWELLPQGNHIQIAACEAQESAFEDTRRNRGFFTTALLDILETTKEPLSYYDLMRKVRIQIKHRRRVALPQSPTCYAVHDTNKTVLFNKMFGAKGKDKALSGDVFYNSIERRWQIDIGAIAGVVPGSENDQQVLMHDEKGKEKWAYIKKVFTDHAQLKFLDFPPTSKNAKLKGYIGGLMARDLNIFLAGNEEGIALLQKQYDADEIYKKEYKIDLVTDEKQADFTVFVTNNKTVNVTKPFDHQRPLYEQQSVKSDKGVKQTLDTLKKVTKWCFLKKLKNPSTFITPEKPIIAEFILSDKTVLQPNDDGVVYIPLKANHSGKWKGKFSMKFTNISDGFLYVAAFMMSKQMGINYHVLEQDAVRLNSNEDDKESVLANSGKMIRLTWDNYLTDFDWAEDTIRFKLIISTVPFNVAQFQQDGFKQPLKDVNFMSGSLSDDPEPPDWQSANTWTTQYFEVRTRNPFKN